MTAIQFKAWRRWMGWSQRQAGEAIGMTARSVQLYEHGKRRVPKTVELSCEALSRGVRSYGGPEETAHADRA